MSGERSFVVLKFAGRVPTLAGCSQCQRKFFAPTSYQGDREGAEQYLRGKFDLHECEEPTLNRRSALQRD